eukprot:649835-Pyramimonas_sp.AAC.1
MSVDPGDLRDGLTLLKKSQFDCPGLHHWVCDPNIKIKDLVHLLLPVVGGGPGIGRKISLRPKIV